MKRYALLTVTPDQPRYFVPCLFSARLWAWAGFEPVVWALDKRYEWETTPLTAWVLERLRELASVTVIMPPRVPGWSCKPSFHEATAVRRLVAAMCFDPTSYVMLGDADMLALRDDYFDCHLATLQVWGVDMYSTTPGAVPRWPACYQGAQSSVWADVMRPASTDLEAATLAHMERTRDYAERVYGAWDCEPGFHAEFAAHPVPVETFTRYDLGPGAERLYLRDGAPACRRPIDCHIRGDWQADARWAQFLAAAGRTVPAGVLADLSDDRATALELLGDWQAMATAQGGA